LEKMSRGQDVKKSAERLESKPEPIAAEAPEVAAPPMDMETLRDHISNMVRGNAETMVQKTIDQVNGGQYQAMKYLFEMIGLFPATVTPEDSPEDSLSGMLLARLGICDETAAEAGQTNRVK
jgi:hypothetical protein